MHEAWDLLQRKANEKIWKPHKKRPNVSELYLHALQTLTATFQARLSPHAGKRSESEVSSRSINQG